MTGETPEVRSDKRKQKMEAMAAIAASICIQISKRLTMYIGRNAQNLKKLEIIYMYNSTLSP